jgi:hypothetical protein
MSKKLLSLSIFAIALAVAFVFWAPNGTMAEDNNNHAGYMNSPNSFGDSWDSATNNAGEHFDRDRDRATEPPPIFKSYGLQGDWRGQQ